MTSYDKPYKVFDRMTKDYPLQSLTEPQQKEIKLHLLEGAIVEFHNSVSDLSDRDDITEQFTDNLSDKEIEILGIAMSYKWTDQYVLNTDFLKQYNLDFSSANKQKQNIATRDLYLKLMDKKITNFGYSKNWE